MQVCLRDRVWTYSLCPATAAAFLSAALTGGPVRHIKNVLVVEDDESVLRVTCRMLQELGFQTVACGGVHDACSVLKQTRVDLVLSDFQLHDGTAQDVLLSVATKISAKLTHAVAQS